MLLNNCLDEKEHIVRGRKNYMRENPEMRQYKNIEYWILQNSV